MKKLLLSTIILLSSTGTIAASNSSIPLLSSGEVKPAESLAISLNPLIKNVDYDVSCYVSNDSADNVDMRFDLETKTSSGSSKFLLNDIMLKNNQDTLRSGDNIVTVTVSLQGDGNSISFKNLDFSHSVHVRNCVAKPALQTLKSKTLAMSGYFIAYNDTDRTVEIGVGNVFPTSYTIAPHSNKWVVVSTDNQNIHINKIS